MTTTAATSSQPLDYLLVLDFEATCEDGDRSFPNEIIEFPTVLLNTKTLQVEDEFRTFVKPTKNKILTNFCKTLTGITQEEVDNGVDFAQALVLHRQWLEKHNFLENGRITTTTKKFAFLTCGDWDLGTCLPTQCKRDGVQFPEYYKSWVNIKHVFTDTYNIKAFGMTHMLELLKMELQGHHHLGIDDCRNIARIAKKMIEDGKSIYVTRVSKEAKKTAATVAKAEEVPQYSITFAPIDGTASSIGIGLRPSKAQLVTNFTGLGLTHVISVLNPSEGAKSVEQFFSTIPTLSTIKWQLCEARETKESVFSKQDVQGLAKTLAQLKQLISGQDATKILVHCNDGKHRSAFFVYLLLRYLGKTTAEALQTISTTRTQSAEALKESFITQAEGLLQEINSLSG